MLQGTGGIAATFLPRNAATNARGSAKNYRWLTLGLNKKDIFEKTSPHWTRDPSQSVSKVDEPK